MHRPTSRTVAAALAALALLFVAADSAQALQFRSFDTDRHTRSLTNSSFIGIAYDWTGVSRGGRTTLVSPSFFISADHSHPSVGSTLTYDYLSGSTPASLTRTIASGQTISGTDIWLGQLNSAVPSQITSYAIPFYTDIQDYVGTTIFTYGAPNLVGRNVVDFVGTAGGVNGTVMIWGYDNPGLGGDETVIDVGDSGRPSFMVVGGELMFLGAHYFQTLDGGGQPNGSGDSFVRSSIAAINTAIAGTGSSDQLDVRPVPEPSAFFLLGVGLAGAWAWRRRRTA